MVQQNIDFIGGGFKLTFPYTFVGWVLWALGLVLTGIGIVAATSDLAGLGVSAVGMVVLAIASPGSMSAGLHRMRKKPSTLKSSRPRLMKAATRWKIGSFNKAPSSPPMTRTTGFSPPLAPKLGTQPIPTGRTVTVHRSLSTQPRLVHRSPRR